MTDEHPTRRRRRRPSGGAVPSEPTTVEKPAPSAQDHRHERADRELAGLGHSQIGVQRAMRARDVNRPSDEDLAEAERDVVIVRRNWTPPV